MAADTGAAHSIAEVYAGFAASLGAGAIPGEVRQVAENCLLDFAGLCIAARDEDYIGAITRSWDGQGACTALGHAPPMDAAGAAVINGTAAHGEDYDDTFEGSPVHPSAPMWPAILAACERYGRGGGDALKGFVAGAELLCRLTVVAPTAIHRAGFHPTAVMGALGAAVGVGAALGLDRGQITNALGIAGSMASGIIEYLAEGTWTKRLHPGWAAQCGLRAALMGQHGFSGPRTVLEGEHGFFFAFADHGIEPDYSHITDGLGETWRAQSIAFKPYACGTMTQPFIDCAIRLAEEGVPVAEIEDIVCKVGEGTVHRLWEPVAEKQTPSTPYSAKFSGQFCVAVGLVDRAAGLSQFTEDKVRDADILDLARRVRHEIDPDDEYPRNYSGHVRATLKDGTVHEARQPHLRGGVREPLTRADLEAKFRANAQFAGYSDAQADAFMAACAGLLGGADMDGLKVFRAAP